jgi:hypothetical protein
MREEYLHFAFQKKLFGNSFQTTTGENLEVKDFGELNSNAGPDFLNTRVLLDGTYLAGSIEFHVKSSDWYIHGHQHDSRYHNVVAHFVFEHDQHVEVNGSVLPTVELKKKIDQDHYLKFQKLTESIKTIPCATSIVNIDSIYITQQKERALLHRLERKSDLILSEIRRLNGDLESAFYLSLAKTFGGKVNAMSFETLIEKISVKALKKMRSDENTIPAVLFGVSGLLPESSSNDYVNALIREFSFQKVKLDLTCMDLKNFRFSRMHPAGFPTIRLAQMAELFKVDIIISEIIDGTYPIADLRKLFQIYVPDFWKTRYRFEKEVRQKSVCLSDEFIDLIFINTIIPFTFATARYNGNEHLKILAMDWLCSVHAEQNAVIAFWTKLGVESDSAFDSQALIEQKNEFCSKKKCLICTIGQQLLKP